MTKVVKNDKETLQDNDGEMTEKVLIELDGDEATIVSLILGHYLNNVLGNKAINEKEWITYKALLDKFLDAGKCPYRADYFIKNITAISQGLKQDGGYDR